MNRFAYALILLLQAAGAPGQEGTITGRILSADGAPASRIRVGAMMIPEPGTPDGGPSATTSLTLTDDAGRYRLEGIPPGQYYVIAGFLDSPTYHPGVAGAVEAQAIEIDAGAVISNIDFSLKRSAGVRVAGRVANIPGVVDRAALRVILTGTVSSGAVRPFPAMESTLSPDATFEFLRIPPGKYSLRLVSTANTMLVTTTLGVADADVPGVELTVPPIVLGRVTVEDGSPLPIQTAAVLLGIPNPPAFIRFQVRTLTNIAQTSTVGRDGTFLLALPAGEYQFSATLLPIGYNIKTMTQGMSDLRQNPLKVTGDAVSEVHVTLTTAPEPELTAVSVSGQITGLPADTDISQLWILLQSVTTIQTAGTDRPAQRVGDTPLRPDATFEFKNVAPGPYTLRLYPPDRFSANRNLTVSDQDVRGITLTALPVQRTPGGAMLLPGPPPPPPPPPPPTSSTRR